MAATGDGPDPDRDMLKQEVPERDRATAPEGTDGVPESREAREAEEGPQREETSADSDASAAGVTGEEPVVDVPALQAEVQRLTEQNRRLAEEREQLDASRKQLQDAYVRMQADFENFRRRTREQEEQRRLEAAEKVLIDLLPVVDNLERALAAAQAGGAESVAGIRDGVQLILQQMRQLLEKHGVQGAPGVGEVFDPLWHEAVAQEPPSGAGQAEDAQLIVVEEFQKGYRLGRKVLRPSLVKVGTASPDAGDQGGPGEVDGNSGDQHIADPIADGDGQ